MENKNILIAGGTGFLGNSLERYFSGMGFTVRILTRNPKRKNEIAWNAKDIGNWVSEISWANVLINLTGKSVDCRYTDKNKKEILESRILSTAILSKAISKSKTPPKLWLNAASSTIYVHSETKQMTEDDGIIGDDFSMNVCKQWEDTFFKDDLNHTRRVALRTSIVLGQNGGAYPKLKKLALFFMGGKQGNGKQYISWIHILDFCRAIDFIIHHPEVVGAVNIVAPKPTQNDIFMRTVRKSLGISFGINQPKWILELGAKLIGTEAELILKSRNVIPERLLEKGFNFKYPNLANCLLCLQK